MSDIEALSSAQAVSEVRSPGFENASEGSNKFQHAISAWRTIDYTTLTSNLDNTASEIVSYQRDSTVQRKDLAQKTKAFRKLDDDSKLAEVKGLLKAYQTFIDLLTNHSKSVNSAFLKVYTSLSEAPDPYPLLEASVDSMLASEDAMPKLAMENERLQQYVNKLTTQLENTENRLQMEILARNELQNALEKEVKDVETSWIAVLDEKEDNWATREKALEERVENQERLLSEVKASYEVNQRLGMSNDDDQQNQHGHIAVAEVEMLHADLERTSARLAEMEARNEQLRLDLAQAKSHVSARTTSLEDDPAYVRMRSENYSLIRKLDASRLEKEGLKRGLDMRLRMLEREAALLKEERDGLKAKVQNWSDYNELKQELDVLKSIEFAADDDGDLPAGKDDAEQVAKPGAESLEKLLLARNKKLGDELTVLRVSHQDLQVRVEELQELLSQTNADLERAQLLNSKLENDLSNVQYEFANAFPSGASVAMSRHAPSGALGKKGARISPTSSIISGIDPHALGGEPVASGHGILPMVTAQRDRFKKKNAQLERELSDCHRTVFQLRQEVAALQKDNLNLYEKTRYMSTYNRSGLSASSSSAAFGLNPNPSTVPIGVSTNSGIAMERYQKAYESNISPFVQFRGRESARAYKRLSLPERVVYTMTRMVLASRTSRNLFAAYCLVLHMLVFISMYWLASVDVTHHISSVGAAASGAVSNGGARTMEDQDTK
ncbi:Golgi membrane protein [Sodiomyces alkalinus F11]|uniref:Protein CASP n=1 Tax=Sodiomyces alkalinus (strain CBS 110278 / VKM F-3762 / F11) TaxID=1314773 RepID=A0A3N2Q035_SODAK|nr:Golgi membrane protein [Sodiomyces alkalinus F11]ROT40131.1 Golgi membrane protein [Sodiomyces alkalinus F11]